MKIEIDLPPEVMEVLAQQAAMIAVEKLMIDDPLNSAWLDVNAAARYLACKPRRIYDLHSQRRIPAHKDGARLLFRRSELDAYITNGDRD